MTRDRESVSFPGSCLETQCIRGFASVSESLQDRPYGILEVRVKAGRMRERIRRQSLQDEAFPGGSLGTSETGENSPVCSRSRETSDRTPDPPKSHDFGYIANFVRCKRAKHVPDWKSVQR
jgi:hypothetical protein